MKTSAHANIIWQNGDVIVWRENDQPHAADLLVAGNIPTMVQNLQAACGGFCVVKIDGDLHAIINRERRLITHDTRSASFVTTVGVRIAVSYLD
jgi:hypothetical protein